MPAKAIIERLKKGSVKDVVLFSNGMKIPPPPCVIVKPETGIIPNTRQYRIIARHGAGRFDELENYVLKELDGLLPGWIEDGEGSRYKLCKGGWTGITAEPESGTYFMERIYFSPLPGKQ